ncbi:hypothetical protein [Flavobacterium sp.]|uniref:hypothetical protein n=1 Tax=Flavobacterium sp. TaxID=239 RepID=UPI002B4B8E82|nr:hypothetical protein [Flavobacterium sp.]HLP63866.1 hypothetical protein [Flavobacterium sp.]
MNKILLFLFIVLSTSINYAQEISLPQKNKDVIESVVKFGPTISSTYEKAVCTELVIQILEKFTPLTKIDKSRIRIITNQDIYGLLKQNSPIPKGVYHALTSKGIGEPIDELSNVLPGDFVQFWTGTWGHCGIVKSVDFESKTMELYSSFPSTNGYGIQTFDIPKQCYFVRLK